MRPRDTVDAFSRLYYDARLYSRITWHGVQLLKYPTDLLVYAELVWRTRPRTVVETGTFAGGMALFLAEQLDAVGAGSVMTVDVEDWSGPGGYPAHPRILYAQGSSTSERVLEQVRERARLGGGVMVVLDGCHEARHVLDELDAYGPLVTPGCYLVVEDTNVPQVAPERGPSHPAAALEAWLPAHPEFVVDRECERFMLTAAPGGWLRRV